MYVNVVISDYNTLFDDNIILMRNKNSIKNNLHSRFLFYIEEVKKLKEKEKTKVRSFA